MQYKVFKGAKFISVILNIYFGTNFSLCNVLFICQIKSTEGMIVFPKITLLEYINKINYINGQAGLKKHHYTKHFLNNT